jgi:hypothetical protein
MAGGRLALSRCFVPGADKPGALLERVVAQRVELERRAGVSAALRSAQLSELDPVGARTLLAGLDLELDALPACE